ncbi:MAG TPA: serine hydrolase [Devosia sp.]|nr:serine hydrolase [Devosia sp.]
MIRRIVLGLIAALVVIVAGLAIYLAVAPPELLRVGDGYAAKIVCSNVFLAGRNPQEVLNTDVQAPGNPLLRLVGVTVDRSAGTVTAKILGFVAPQVAIARPGHGCTLVPDGRLDHVAALPPALPQATGGAAWAEAPDAAIARLIADPTLAGPGARAIVVARGGRIVAERYAGGFDARTPLLGWSMAKTVNAMLIGTLMLKGSIGLDDAGLFPQWTDARKDIRLRDLAAMTGGLAFNEEYGDVSDVNRMLFLEPDMAGFAASQPSVARPGTVFSYSTGTATMLARLWMDRVGADAANYPRQALFAPIGADSAVIEADEAGTLVGSSYMYATARDWARIGQLLAQDGVWNGLRLLPEGFVKLMQTPNGLPGGYSQMQTWLEPDSGLPEGSFWLDGHDGQSIAVIPSAQLVIVRLGLTPSDLGYSAIPLAKAVLAASQ